MSNSVAVTQFASTDGDLGATLEQPVAALHLGVRASNVLAADGIALIGDLVQWRFDDFLKLRNCGVKTAQHVRQALNDLGLDFGMTWDRASGSIGREPRQLPHLLSSFDADTRAKFYIGVEELGLSGRTMTFLKRRRMNFVGDLVGPDKQWFLSRNGCTPGMLHEIERRLEMLELGFGIRISDWDTRAAKQQAQHPHGDLSRSVSAARRSIPNTTAAASLESELRGILEFCADRAREVEFCEKYLGWSGKGRRTLESVGKDYGVTSERVRQIIIPIIKNVRLGNFHTPLLDAAIVTATKLCPASQMDLLQGLKASGLTNGDFDPTGLQTAAEVFQRQFDISKFQVGTGAIFAKQPDYNLLTKIFEVAEARTSSSGCVCFDALCDELDVPVSARPNFRRFIGFGTCAWIDESSGWLVSTNVDHNRLSNVIKKVLSVCSPIDLAVLWRAVKRSRRLTAVPPIEVFEKFVEHFDLGRCIGGTINASYDFADSIKAGSAEDVMVSILRAHGPTLERNRFRELCIQQGINPITFYAYASSSPLVQELAPSLYSLTGTKLPA